MLGLRSSGQIPIKEIKVEMNLFSMTGKFDAVQNESEHPTNIRQS